MEELTIPHGILNKLKNYVDCSIKKSESSSNYIQLNGIIIYGYYINNSGSIIVITNTYIINMCSRNSFVVLYKDLYKIKLPSVDKYKIDRIYIETRNNQKLCIIIDGFDDKYKDVFEFYRFLRKTIDNIHII